MCIRTLWHGILLISHQIFTLERRKEGREQLRTIYLDEGVGEDPVAVHAAVEHADAEEGGEDDQPGAAVLHILLLPSLTSFLPLPLILLASYLCAKQRLPLCLAHGGAFFF